MNALTPLRSNRRQRGFTLLEILIAVTIIAILSVFVAPQFMDKPEQARIVAAKQDIQALVQALKMYKLDNGNYPSSEQGLNALAAKPSTGKIPTNWKPYVDHLRKDPWGNDYVYLNPGLHGEIDVMSYGKDGQGGAEANFIGNWML